MPLRMHRVSFIGLVAVAACADAPPKTVLRAQLQPLATCADAKAYVRQVALADMNRRIDEAIESYRAGDLCYDYGLEDVATDGQPSPPSAPSDGGPTTGTGTNNQVAGVDEADFVKNDGQYIYLAQNGVFRIVDAWPADQTHVVSTTPLPGTPKKLFVAGDRAVVYVSMGKVGDATSGWERPECTYGYSCDFTGDGTPTKMQVYDISDRAAPRVVREIDLAGSLIAARRVEDAVHTVVTLGSSPFPALRTEPDFDICSYGGGEPPLAFRMAAEREWEKLRAANTKIIEETDLDVRLTGFRDSLAPDADVAETACASLYASPADDGTASTSIVSINMQLPTPVTMSTIISRPGAVYADHDSLYMAVGHRWDGEDVSTVHKFEVSGLPNQTRYIGSGKVPGRALNQFAMDERDDHLRIATTTGRAGGENTRSHLSVLAEQGSDLAIVGQIDNIAPTEDIRSVRFDGTRAFVVTFKKTDPLFAFDLANPHEPKQLGELKIPGFSTYMHMLDNQHLLTIGYDTDDHGSFAYFDGVMLQIFDVSDMTAPALAHKHVIGTRGSSSEALTNHLAFTWYPEYALLSIPMTVCEGGDDGRYGKDMTFSGLMLFDASVAAGFAEHGRVAHPPSDQIDCGNWWTDAKSVVRRSLFLDNYVYSISDSHLKVRDVNALATPLVDLDL